jgi:5'-nucleotidase (lipoprotein e(P4) family)
MKKWMLGALAIALSTGSLQAQQAPTSLPMPPQSDMLLATLWVQRSVEFKANAISAYTLARYRLDEALADKNWTAAPSEQKGDYANLPPAIIFDVDETVLDNSKYQVWMMKADQSFSTKTWNQFCEAQISTLVPGALEFARYADSKGVKLFYVTNRGVETKEATKQNMQKLGFPMGGNVDVFMFQNEKKEWGSAKSTRRAEITKDYRVVLNVGDNFGDFDDRYRGSEADRMKAFEESKDRWGREWIMIANPTYGSFDTAPFGHDFKKPREEQRKAKYDVLEGWAGPKN